MTNEQLLKKAIKKVSDNDNYEIQEFDIAGILTLRKEIKKNKITYIAIERECPAKKGYRAPNSQEKKRKMTNAEIKWFESMLHLPQMVLEKEPLKNLGKFLEKEAKDNE